MTNKNHKCTPKKWCAITKSSIWPNNANQRLRDFDFRRGSFYEETGAYTSVCEDFRIKTDEVSSQKIQPLIRINSTPVRLELTSPGCSKKPYFIILFLLGLAALSVVSCSKSLFDGDHSNDQKVSQFLANHSCYDIDLSSNRLDPLSFRNLIRCLNDNGSISEYAALVNKTTDTQLNGFLDIINQIILPNQKLLNSMVQSFDDLEKQGVLDSFFHQLSQILTQRAVLISGLQLVHRSTFIDGKLDPNILNIIQILMNELNLEKGFRENTKYILEKTIRYTQLDSYQEIMENLATPIPNELLTLHTLSSQVLKYIQEKIKSDHALWKLMLWGIKDRSFYKFLYQYLYPGCSQPTLDECSLKNLEPQVQASQDLFKIVFVEHKEDVLKKTSDLLSSLDSPIDCLADTKRFLNGAMYLIDLFNQQEPLQVPAWFLRNDSLLLKVSASQCKLPKNFNNLIEPLRILADYKGTNSLGEIIDHQPLVTFAYLLRALTAADQIPLDPQAHEDLHINLYPETERYRRMLIQWLADPSPVNIYTHLADTIGVLSQKNILANALYLMNSVASNAEDQNDWVNVASLLMTLRPELKTTVLPSGQSIYDIFTSIILQIDPDNLYKFLSNFADALSDHQNYLTPTLHILREALLTNEQSPFLELIFQVSSQASHYATFFNSIFELSEMKEFEDALGLTVKLSQNGDLKEILRGFLSLFGRIQTGKSYQYKTIPKVTAISQIQNQSAVKQKPIQLSTPYWPEGPTHRVGSIEACKKIDVSISLTDTKNKEWATQALATIDCLNAEGNYWELSDAYKNDLSSPSPFFGQDSFAVFLINRFSDFFKVTENTPEAKAFEKKLFDEVSDRITNKKELKETQNAIGALKYLMEPLKRTFRVFSLFNDKREPLQELLNFVASLVENPKSARATALIYDVSKEISKTPIIKDSIKPNLQKTLPPPFTQNIIEQLKHLLLDTEFNLSTPSNDTVEMRVKQVIEDYWHQVVPGLYKMKFENAEDFKSYLKPLLDDLAQPNALEAALGFFNDMDHNPFDPKWWEGWLQRLSANIRAIPYYYPGNYPDADGNGKPTIRLVNGLELLDLVVIDSDFTLKETKQWRPDIFPDGIFPPADENGAIHYLSILSQAYDAPTAEEVETRTQAWVDHLLKDEAKYMDLVFHGGEKLLQGHTIWGLSNWGLKKIMQPEIRRRVFNLNQIVPILQELNQNKEKATLRNGKQVWRSDLGILRNLFHSVLQATPLNSRNVFTKEANSLRLITHLVASGITKAISVNMWSQGTSGIQPTKVEEILKLVIDSAHDLNAHEGLNQDTKDILNFLIRNNAKPGYSISENPLTYAQGSFDDHYVFLGQWINHIFDWIEHDAPKSPSTLTLLKRSFYELSLLMEQMEHDRSIRNVKSNLPREIIKILKPFIVNKEGTEWIASHMNIIKSFLTNPNNTKFLIHFMDAQNHSKKKHGYQEKEGFGDFIELANNAVQELAADNGHLANTSKDLVIHLNQDPNHLYFNDMSEAFLHLNQNPNFKILKKNTLDHLIDDLIYGMINPGDQKAWPVQLRRFISTELKSGNLASLIEYIGTHSQDDYFFKQDFAFLGKRKYIEGMQTMLSKLGFDVYDIFKSP